MLILKNALHFWTMAAAGDEGAAAGGSATGEKPATSGNTTTNQDPTNLLSALHKERDRAVAADKALDEARNRQAELQTQLDRVQSIDPDKYQQMLDNQRKIEEEALLQTQQWGALRARAEEEVAGYKQTIGSLQTNYDSLLVKDQLGKAFRAAGGIEDIQPIEGAEQINPLELLANYLGHRIKLDNGRVILMDSVGREEKNADGKPKSLGEKMFELKRGSLGNLFRAENTSSGNGSPTNMVRADGKQMTVYTKAQARAGKADMSAIARGEAIIVDG
jgi:hypothetical protein